MTRRTPGPHDGAHDGAHDRAHDRAHDDAPRVVVLWFPDWPVLAAWRHHRRTAGTSEPDPLPHGGSDPHTDLHTDPVAALPPVAVLDRGAVLACSPAARDDGVRRGMRAREAQSLCPRLVTLPYDPAVDVRAFEPVLVAVEAVAPGVEAVRPGMCAIAARGPSRYFGGEDAVAAALRDALTPLDCPRPRIGVADGPFGAAQAALHGGTRPGDGADRIVPAGGSPAFLAELPVEALDRPELAGLLRRMGLRTLGEFASLPGPQVAARFGADGAMAHRLASGRGERRLSTRRPPPDVTLRVALDPPLDRVDAVAFAVRAAADDLVTRLAALDLVTTCVRVTLTGEDGDEVERQWRHPRWFRAADLVDRVRWQVSAATPAEPGAGGTPSGRLWSPVALVRVRPVEVDRIGVHAEGLWGDQAPDDRVHRALTRVQSMLGHTAVLTPVPSGGRGPGEHTTLVPWGDAVTPRRDPALPWPGRLPDPAPSTVLPTPVEVRLLDPAGTPVTVDERGGLSGPPARLESRPGRGAPVEAWCGPWPSDERWWDPATARAQARVQVVAGDRALLLTFGDGGWRIEARYD